MRQHLTSALVVLISLLAFGAEPSAQRPGRALDDLLDRATRYVLAYEQAFSFLLSDEIYVQEIRRPPNPGTNLSRSNPGGGMLAGGPVKMQSLKSDYFLVQLGEGAGWMSTLRGSRSHCRGQQAVQHRDGRPVGESPHAGDDVSPSARP